MKKLFSLKLFLLLFILLISSLVNSQTTLWYNYQIVMRLQTTIGTQSVNAIGTGAVFHNLVWNVSGTVATCSVQVDSSVDGITWNSGDILASRSCTANGTALSASFVANYVRINLTALSGAGATFNANLSGYIANPSGGGGTITGSGTAGVITKWTGTSALGNAAASDIVSLFTSCSGTQYLGADGACHTNSGAVSSVFGRTGAVVAAFNDYTVALGGTGLSTWTLHGIPIGNGTSAPNFLASPTANGFYNCGFNVTASAAVDPTCALPGVTVNAQSGNYSLLYTDRGTYIKFSGGSTATLTLAQITGITAANLPFIVQNLNSGNLTITANAADKIDNSATGGSVTVLPNFEARVFQDSSSAPGNWWTIIAPNFSAFGTTGSICSWSTSTGISCGNLTGDATTTGSKAVTLANLNINATPADYIAGGGSAQAQTATFAPALTALTTGAHGRFLPVAANTATAPTLAVNGLTAKTITKCGATALVAGDLSTAQQAYVDYDGTEWVLENPQAVPCGLSASPVLTGNGATNTTTVITADFTTTSATLVAITGLAWTLPANIAAKYHFDCDLLYSDSTTTSSAVAFGIQDVTTAPTTAEIDGVMWLSATTLTEGNGVVTTTALSSIVSGQPTVSTIRRAQLSGTVEQPSGSASVLQIVADIASAATLTVKRDSSCVLTVSSN